MYSEIHKKRDTGQGKQKKPWRNCNGKILSSIWLTGTLRLPIFPSQHFNAMKNETAEFKRVMLQTPAREKECYKRDQSIQWASVNPQESLVWKTALALPKLPILILPTFRKKIQNGSTNAFLLAQQCWQASLTSSWIAQNYLCKHPTSCVRPVSCFLSEINQGLYRFVVEQVPCV